MRRIIFFSFTAFICSCSGFNNPKPIEVYNKTQKIILVSKPDSVITKISAIASDIEYIPLQHTANTPIKGIDKIVVRSNKFYINLVNNILCFDNQGHFLYKLYGNGENECDYIAAIYDFDIETSDTSLIVLAGNKIVHFKNKVTGFDYIKTIHLGKISTSKLDFVPRTNRFLLSFIRRNGYEPSLNVLISINGDILSSRPNYFKSFNPVNSGIWDKIIHYQFEDKLYLRERFNDTVFSIGAVSNTFAPALILDSRISSTNTENINDPGYFRILPNINDIFEVPRYLYYSYKFSQSDNKVFYDKYENKKYEIDPEYGLLKDDISGGPDFYPKYCSEDIFYSWISAREFKQYIESDDFPKAHVQNPQRQGDLKNLGLSLKESDNPILILVRPKN